MGNPRCIEVLYGLYGYCYVEKLKIIRKGVKNAVHGMVRGIQRKGKRN